MNEMEQNCFDMINSLANAKSLIMNAIDISEDNDLDSAATLIKEAKEYAIEAQKIHLQILSSEASGNKIEISLLFMHTEDQMITVQMLLDIAEKLIRMNGRICSLSQS